MTNCKFLNCVFKNIEIEGDLCLAGLDLQDGEIDGFRFYGNQIMSSHFCSMQAANVDLNCAFMKNRMDRLVFRNVKVRGYNRDNLFADCDTTEFDMV